MEQNTNPQPTRQEQEAKQMKRDFVRAVFTNLFFLILLVALYFANREFGFLNKLMTKF